MSVMISSGFAHSAPSGFGGASPSFAPSSGANIVNASDLPSFDQATDDGASMSSASRVARPASSQWT
jgi:hypothetical protein